MYNLAVWTVLYLILLNAYLVFGGLPAEYKLLLEYKRSKSIDKRIKIGRKIITSYPSAVFIDDLKVLLARDLLKKGRRREAREILAITNIKKIKPDLIEVFLNVSKKLGYVTKEMVLYFPEKLYPYIDRFSFSEDEMLRIFNRMYRMGKRGEAIKLIDRFKERYKKLCYIEARLLYSRGNFDRALDALRDCPHPNAEKFKLRIFLREKRYDKALSFIELHGKEKSEMFLFAGKYVFRDGFPMLSRIFFEKAEDSFEKFFFLGLISYAEYNFKNAVEYFKKAVSFSSNKKELSKASFWVYKALLASRERTEEPSDYLLLSSVGEGFYSATSRVYLGKRVANVETLKASYGDGESKLVSSLIEIKKAGFPYYMRLEALRKMNLFTKMDVLRLSREDTYIAMKIAIRRWGPDSDIYKAVSYKMPYKNIVFRVSKKYNIDPYLVYAIMRQESLFDPYAVSVAGAKGLMQLMDRTARWVSRKYGIKLRNIYDPKQNIEIGVAYLSYLNKLWKGDLAKIIASYNAGEGAVRRWYPYEDVYLFIESIPYNETRNYVKKVLYNFYIYSERDLNSF